MKYLKAENGKGWFSTDSTEWHEIDKLGKDALLVLVNLVLTSDFYMDEFSTDVIQNPAHQIIYKNIYEKLRDLQGNKLRFHDESEQQFREALEKYSRPT